MRISRRALCVVSILIALLATTPSTAQDLLVARVDSLNEVFDDVEAIAQAVGQDLTREMLLMMGSSMLGSDATTIIDLDRPVAAVMPIEGMMLMQNGVVVAVPVIDATAAIDQHGLFGRRLIARQPQAGSGETRPGSTARVA